MLYGVKYTPGFCRMDSPKCANCHWYRQKEEGDLSESKEGYCVYKVKSCGKISTDSTSRRLMVMPKVQAEHVCEHHFPNIVVEKMFS